MVLAGIHCEDSKLLLSRKFIQADSKIFATFHFIAEEMKITFSETCYCGIGRVLGASRDDNVFIFMVYKSN
jgi:hypothetical protein